MAHPLLDLPHVAFTHGAICFCSHEKMKDTCHITRQPLPYLAMALPKIISPPIPQLHVNVCIFKEYRGRYIIKDVKPLIISFAI